eukprot:3384582-Prymnesium_polylepis.2
MENNGVGNENWVEIIEGCHAMPPPQSQTDFVAEVNALLTFNGAMGFVFGRQSDDDYYIALTQRQTCPDPDLSTATVQTQSMDR